MNGPGLSLLAIAVTAGLTGMKLNASHGLEISAEAGLIYGLADATKILLPIICGIIGWNYQTRCVAAICVFASLRCASSAYLDGAGRDQLARQHGAATYADKAKVVAELERDVARLQAQALAEGKSGGCKQNCRAVNEQAAVASQRLAAARGEKAAAQPVEISGMAGSIAALTRTGIDETARGIGVFKAAIFLVLVEALVWLSIPAMALLASVSPRRSGPEAGMPPVIVVDPEPVKLVRAGTSAYYRTRIERERPGLAERITSGELSVHAASLAAGLRKPRRKSKWTTIDALRWLGRRVTPTPRQINTRPARFAEAGVFLPQHHPNSAKFYRGVARRRKRYGGVSQSCETHVARCTKPYSPTNCKIIFASVKIDWI